MAKKLTPEEIKGLSLARAGRRHPISMLIEQLEPGEGLLIHRNEWNDKKRTPSYLVTRAAAALGRKYQFLKQTDGQAWVVERLA